VESGDPQADLVTRLGHGDIHRFEILKIIQAPDSLREVYFPLRRVAIIRMTCS
jgi:hypothetical protein